MIHKPGAIVSRSGEQRSFLRKDHVCWRSLRVIEGWLGNQSSYTLVAGVRSRTSSVACRNGGIAVRRRNVVAVKPGCAPDWGSADV